MTGNPPLLITCVGVEHDVPLLPHFLRHYLALGIQPERMRVIVNAVSINAPGLNAAQSVLGDFGVKHVETWIAPYTSASMWEKRREVQVREAAPDDWVISADVDELHEYPEPLDDFLGRCDKIGADCVQGPFIDRLASGGTLAPIVPEASIMEQFPLMTDVIWALGGQGKNHDQHGTVKIMAIKGRVLPSRGGHHPLPDQPMSYLYRIPLAQFPAITDPAFRFSIPSRVHHFHWTDALVERLERRLATPGVSPAGAEYGAKQLSHISEHGGISLERVAMAEELKVDDWQSDLERMRRLAQKIRLKNAIRRPIGRIKRMILP